MAESETVWTITCAGGCGRTLRTNKLTTLFTVTTCPDCAPASTGDAQ